MKESSVLNSRQEVDCISRKKVIIIMLLSFLLGTFLSLILIKVGIYNYEHVRIDDDFKGLGTLESPYLIQDENDIATLRDRVNAGEKFLNMYFLQTTDLDLSAIDDWEPIGVYGSNNYFYGVYDGGNHSVSSLTICGDMESETGNVGLFGQLGGTILNLKIESGSISGFCVGSFASHATGENAKIINCINYADVAASNRAGGIADNFNGKIVACVNYGALNAPLVGEMISYSATELDFCMSRKADYGNEYFSGVDENTIIDQNITEGEINQNLQSVIDSTKYSKFHITLW